MANGIIAIPPQSFTSATLAEIDSSETAPIRKWSRQSIHTSLTEVVILTAGVNRAKQNKRKIEFESANSTSKTGPPVSQMEKYFLDHLTTPFLPMLFSVPTRFTISAQLLSAHGRYISYFVFQFQTLQQLCTQACG